MIFNSIHPLGTPIMSNVTSDIGMYIEDGKQGIILKENSREAMIEGLERAMQLSIEERMEMRQECNQLAANSFDYRLWS